MITITRAFKTYLDEHFTQLPPGARRALEEISRSGHFENSQKLGVTSGWTAPLFRQHLGSDHRIVYRQDGSQCTIVFIGSKTKYDALIGNSGRVEALKAARSDDVPFVLPNDEAHGAGGVPDLSTDLMAVAMQLVSAIDTVAAKRADSAADQVLELATSEQERFRQTTETKLAEIAVCIEKQGDEFRQHATTEEQHAAQANGRIDHLVAEHESTLRGVRECRDQLATIQGSQRALEGEVSATRQLASDAREIAATAESALHDVGDLLRRQAAALDAHKVAQDRRIELLEREVMELRLRVVELQSAGWWSRLRSQIDQLAAALLPRTAKPRAVPAGWLPASSSDSRHSPIGHYPVGHERGSEASSHVLH